MNDNLVQKQRNENETNYELLQQKLRTIERERDKYKRMWINSQKCYDTKYSQLYNLQIEANQLRKDKLILSREAKKNYTQTQFLCYLGLVIFIVCQLYEYDYD